MTPQTTIPKVYTIDAAGVSLGRVASAVAALLRGKSETTFSRHLLSGIKVNVVNADRLKISAKKGRDKQYVRYTGYPGGLRMESLNSLDARRGREELIRRAVYGMLPANKLRAQIIKNLKVV